MSKRKLNNDYSDICERFKQLRLEHGMTQKEMAEVVGLSTPAIGAIENKLYTPNFGVLRALKKRFNTDYAYLIDGQVHGEIENLRQENAKLREELARLTKVVDKLVK